MFSRRVLAGLRKPQPLAWLASPWFVLLALIGGALPAATPRACAQASAALTPEETEQWFVGAYYRHAWVPSLMLKPLFERAAGINNHGFGLSVSHASRGGGTVELGLGYQAYHFEGAFNPNDAAVEDTEYVQSNLALVHFTGSLLWPIPIHRKVIFDLGIGLDFGLVTGNLRRTEAYPRDGAFHPCEGALNPGIVGPDADAQGDPIPYCEQAYDSSGARAETSGATVSGAHYNDAETRVPPLMLVPMLPHMALRFLPSDRVAIKLEAAFGLVQFWLGASIHIGLGRRGQPVELPSPVPVAAEAPLEPVGAVQQHHVGRLIGKLMEESTGKPIAHGSVKNKRLFSAIQTDAAGLFVFENLEPGEVQLSLSHPDYEPGTCTARIPEEGGDVNVHCFLRAGNMTGAISGQVKDPVGNPVPGARIEIAGPITAVTQSDASGLFALVDAPEGTYRLLVRAPGYLAQIVEVELGPRETAMPQIILLKTSEPAPQPRTKP